MIAVSSCSDHFDEMMDREIGLLNRLKDNVPVVTITYSTTSPTNTDVTAILESTKGISMAK